MKKAAVGAAFAIALLIWIGFGLVIYYLLIVRIIREDNLLDPIPVPD